MTVDVEDIFQGRISSNTTDGLAKHLRSKKLHGKRYVLTVGGRSYDTIHVHICHFLHVFSDQCTRDGTLFQKMVKNDTFNSLYNSAKNVCRTLCIVRTEYLDWIVDSWIPAWSTSESSAIKYLLLLTSQHNTSEMFDIHDECHDVLWDPQQCATVFEVNRRKFSYIMESYMVRLMCFILDEFPIRN